MKSLIIRFKPLQKNDSNISFEVKVGDFRKKFCGEVLGINSILSISYGNFNIEKQINMTAKSINNCAIEIDRSDFANQIHVDKSILCFILKSKTNAIVNILGCALSQLRSLFNEKKYLSKVNCQNIIGNNPNIDFNKNYYSKCYDNDIIVNKGTSLKAQNNDSLKFLSKIATSVKNFLSGLLFCRSRMT